MSLGRKGFVALLTEPLTETLFGAILESWLTRFDAVEQLRSLGDGKAAGFAVHSPQDVKWEKDLQFRVLAGEQFAWVYLTDGGRVIESDGLAPEQGESLSLDVLLEIPSCERVVNDRDDATLDDWEAKGLM